MPVWWGSVPGLSGSRYEVEYESGILCWAEERWPY